jgi:ADP-ribose pyrophosphatase YjhB (NUDIX family)
MSSRHYPSTPLLGACTAIWRGDRFLLAKRTAEPNSGTWAMPGGLVEVGETLEQAALREVREETQLILPKVIFNRFHELIRPDDQGRISMHYVLAMFVSVSPQGEAIAGDDAGAVAWYGLDDLANLPLTGSTEAFVHESMEFLPRLLADADDAMIT